VRGPAARHLSMTLATAQRVLRQLSHDRRTIALLLAVPVLLLVLLYHVFDGQESFNTIGAALLGIFPMITMFLVTSIATLRERAGGTLERLLTMPMGKGDLILGYAVAFGAFAVLQASIATATAIWLLDLSIAGSPWLLLLVALLNALLGTALGLFVSAFAASEFQAVQFFPALIVPQILLCGLFAPRGDMQPVLSAVDRDAHGALHYVEKVLDPYLLTWRGRTSTRFQFQQELGEPGSHRRGGLDSDRGLFDAGNLAGQDTGSRHHRVLRGDDRPILPKDVGRKYPLLALLFHSSPPCTSKQRRTMPNGYGGAQTSPLQ
jgi:ABC-2 type transport system permease protein